MKTFIYIFLLCSSYCCLFAQNKVIYPYDLDVKEHPDHLRYHVKAPDYSVFDNKTQFIALRDLSGDNYKERMSLWVDKYKLGNILWVSYPLIYQDNLKEVVSEIKKRNLYLMRIRS